MRIWGLDKRPSCLDQANMFLGRQGTKWVRSSRAIVRSGLSFYPWPDFCFASLVILIIWIYSLCSWRRHIPYLWKICRVRVAVCGQVRSRGIMPQTCLRMVASPASREKYKYKYKYKNTNINTNTNTNTAELHKSENLCISNSFEVQMQKLNGC